MVLGSVRTPETILDKNATFNKSQVKILAVQQIVKVLQLFEVVRGPHGPRISILGLNYIPVGIVQTLIGIIIARWN